MDEPLQPIDCHPDLQIERLEALAQFFASTRAEVAALHDALNGDDNWSLGCRGFARWRNMLIAKARTGEWPWLSVTNPGKRFIFKIGAVPIRFYKGTLKNLPARTLAHTHEELSQLSLAFADTNSSLRHLKWRFAISTDVLGYPSAVHFAGLSNENNGKVAHQWSIPFETLADFNINSVNTADLVELPAPKVAAIGLKKREASSDD